MKKNGFTLVELLAVIIVIGLLAIIIIPKIKDTLTDSKKSANEISANSLVRTATNYYLEKRADKSFQNCTYDFTNNNNSCNGFEFTGEKPESGKLQIKKDGTVALAVQFEDYCYIKAFDNESIEIIDYDSNTCGKNAYVFTNYELPEVVTYGDGLYASNIEPGRYVYRGKNVNNYIKLKENNADVIYRIISYEKDGSIKVIRDTSIGNMAWDERTSETEGPRRNDNNTYCNYTGTYYGCNVWSNMNDTTYNGTPLSTLFSNNFHYKYFSSSTSELLDHSTNGTVKDNSSLNTYLNGEWLNNSGLNDYINPNTNFSVGGLYYYSTYTGGDKGLEKELEEINSYKWQGKVGLMYITDMVETSLSNSCDSVYDNFYYNPNYYYKDTGSETASQHITNGNWPCTKDNWLFKGITEWSLSANSYNRSSVWYVYSTGYFSNNTCYAIGARPAFYLKSSIQLRGSGTISDPYEIVTN